MRTVVTTAAASMAALLSLASCGELKGPTLDCAPAPEPKRTAAPAPGPLGWLGDTYAGHTFHSVERDGPLVAVRYGQPSRVAECGSGSAYTFPFTVTTAPRHPTTRRRLRRSLGPGVRIALGTRFGCGGADGPTRVAVLTATARIEITGAGCSGLLRASRALSLR